VTSAPESPGAQSEALIANPALRRATGAAWAALEAEGIVPSGHGFYYADGLAAFIRKPISPEVAAAARKAWADALAGSDLEGFRLDFDVRRMSRACGERD
jgi:hypothetical protein